MAEGRERDHVGDERRPGPPSTLDELRERLIDAGVDALLRSGVTLGLEEVRVADAIEATDSSRASAYRALADDDLEPQELLRKEVLSRILRRSTRGQNHRAILRVVMAEHDRRIADLESDDPTRRRSAVLALIRVGTAVSFANVSTSRERAILTAAYGAMSSRPDEEFGWQHEALTAGEADLAADFGDSYLWMMRLAGNRLRSGVTIEQFSVATAALLEGLAMRSRLRDDLTGISLASGPDDGLDDWTLFGLAVDGLVLSFFEPDPDDPRAVDLRIP